MATYSVRIRIEVPDDTTQTQVREIVHTLDGGTTAVLVMQIRCADKDGRNRPAKQWGFLHSQAAR